MIRAAKGWNKQTYAAVEARKSRASGMTVREGWKGGDDRHVCRVNHKINGRAIGLSSIKLLPKFADNLICAINFLL